MCVGFSYHVSYMVSYRTHSDLYTMYQYYVVCSLISVEAVSSIIPRIPAAIARLSLSYNRFADVEMHVRPPVLYIRNFAAKDCAHLFF